METKLIHDFSQLDLNEQYKILKNAKELLAYLNDTDPDFPYMDAYYDGTMALIAALTHLDGKLLQGEEQS